MVTAIVGDSSS